MRIPSSPCHNPFRRGKACWIYHHNVHDYHHNICDYHHNIHNYHCNNILVRDYHSVVVAAGNDTTRHGTPSLETSARHDKGGGYSGYYPRAIPSTMAGIQHTFTKFFLYIFYLLTTTTASNVMNKEDSQQDNNNNCQCQWDPHHLETRDGGHFLPSTSCFDFILHYILVYILI